MIAILAPLLLQFAQSPLQVTPNHPNTFYQVGETITWTIPQNPSAEGTYKYELKRNNFAPLKSGSFDPSKTDSTITFKADEPSMLFLQITAPNGAKKDYAAGIEPQKIKSTFPRPKDFDQFWRAKTDLAKNTKIKISRTPGDAPTGIKYETFEMNHPMNGRITGQMARPDDNKKHPALLQVQWAGVYSLDKSWIMGYAQSGFITMNIQAHDVQPIASPEYFKNLPQEIQNYNSINQNDLESNYFVRMYVSGYTALEQLSKDPQWDGKTLVVMGTSMGGQQAIALAGLHTKVTHMIANVPAGSDIAASLHNRQAGYPFFNVADAKVAAVAPYVDGINFAPRIKAKSLIGLGFVDTVCPPFGIWATFNLIPGPKEIVPMPDSPHNHLATPAQQKPFNDRNWQWLQSIAKGEDVKPRTLDETLKSAAGTR